MTHREMVAGDLYPSRSGTKFICDLPGPGPWHMCRVAEGVLVFSPTWSRLGRIENGIVTWIDPVAEIQA